MTTVQEPKQILYSICDNVGTFFSGKYVSMAGLGLLFFILSEYICVKMFFNIFYTSDVIDQITVKSRIMQYSSTHLIWYEI